MVQLREVRQRESVKQIRGERMKKYRLMAVAALLAAGWFVLAAGGAQGAAKARENAGDWRKKWEETLAAAKKEGEVLIYLNAPSEAREAISEAFYKKHGLKLGVVLGSGAQLTSKLLAEYRAGINQVDVFMPGATSI